MTSRALVLLAHGSRDPNWARPIVAVAERIGARPDAPAVAVAYLEFASPTFAEAVARLADAGATHVRVAPVFLGQGGHLRRDVDALLAEARTRHPALHFEIAAPLGEDPALLDAIAGWAMK